MGAMLVAGCGSNVSEDLGWTSGARLRARVTRTADGARQFVGWHDRERGADCGFVTLSDGRLRCAPGALALHAYADAACTQEVGVVFGCDEATHVRVEQTSDPCTVRYAIHPLGEVVDESPTTIFYRAADGTCIVGGELPDGVTFSAIGAEEAPASFVAADIVREVNGPVTNAVLVADDGARLITGDSYDETGARLVATNGRWIPEAHDGSYRADVACDEPVGCMAPAPDSTCPAPILAPYSIEFDFDACGALQLVVRALGASATANTRQSTMECAPVDAPEALVCYAAGEPLALEDFPAITELLHGTGRVRTKSDGIAGGGTLRFAEYPFWDTELDVACVATSAADGVRRCVAYERSVWAEVDLFSDDECTQPAAYRHVPGDDCNPTPPVPRYANHWSYPETSDPCDGVTLVARAFRVGGELPPDAAAQLFHGSPDDCASYDSATAPGGVYGITEIPPDDFVTAEEVVE